MRQYYLASKYFKKWRLYSLRDIAKSFHLTESSWLKHFLFCSSTRLLRHVACAIFEGIAQVPERKKEVKKRRFLDFGFEVFINYYVLYRF